MRATYHLIVIDDFYDLFIHPTLALPHIPLHLLTFIITILHRLLFCYPLSIHRSVQSLYPWLHRSELSSWHFISTISEKTIRKKLSGVTSPIREVARVRLLKIDELLFPISEKRGITVSCVKFCPEVNFMVRNIRLVQKMMQ